MLVFELLAPSCGGVNIKPVQNAQKCLKTLIMPFSEEIMALIVQNPCQFYQIFSEGTKYNANSKITLKTRGSCAHFELLAPSCGGVNDKPVQNAPKCLKTLIMLFSEEIMALIVQNPCQFYQIFSEGARHNAYSKITLKSRGSCARS